MHEWRTVTLGDIADIRVSNVNKKSSPGEKPVRLCNYMDVYSNEHIRAGLPFMEATATGSEIARFGLKAGDVLITKDSETPDDIGISAVIEDDIEALVCGYHLAMIRPAGQGVDSRYLAKQLALPSTAAYFAQRATGSTRYGLSNRTIAGTPIRLGPTAQQKRIADVLACVNSAIERAEFLIEKHQQIKSGLMHDLFTRGVLPNGKLRPSATVAPELFAHTSLGPLPSEWTPSTAGRAFEIASGITLGPHRRPARNARPYLRVANVYRDELRLEDIAMLEALRSDGGCVLKEFDLLVVEGHANSAEIGRCAMVTLEAAGMLFQNHLFRLRPLDLDATFALLWLNSHHIQRYWERTCATSSGLNTINRRMLAAAPIFVPSKSEQVRIVASASAARSMLDKEQARLQKLRAQKCGLMQDLLTGKVPVRVPEPAVPA